MPEISNNTIIYEQPLGERIRAFLRLEYLFSRAAAQLGREDDWSIRVTLEALIDIMSLVGRTELKKELIKELERHASTLTALSRNPKVDHERLEHILTRLRTLLKSLRGGENSPGHELRHSEFLSAVKQRVSIPAGTCDFDMPSLHFWLHRAGSNRLTDLERWLASFEVVRDAIALCLALVRESATATSETATGGFFQQTLESSNPCQMIRIAIDREVECFPEISAGKHRFTVRFMRVECTDNRPIQTEGDVQFKLLRCVI